SSDLSCHPHKLHALLVQYLAHHWGSYIPVEAKSYKIQMSTAARLKPHKIPSAGALRQKCRPADPHHRLSQNGDLYGEEDIWEIQLQAATNQNHHQKSSAACVPEVYVHYIHY